MDFERSANRVFWVLFGGAIGAKQGEEERYFTLGLEGGTPVPLTPGGSTNFDGQKPISPDGRTRPTRNDR